MLVLLAFGRPSSQTTESVCSGFVMVPIFHSQLKERLVKLSKVLCWLLLPDFRYWANAEHRITRKQLWLVSNASSERCHGTPSNPQSHTNWTTCPKSILPCCGPYLNLYIYIYLLCKENCIFNQARFLRRMASPSSQKDRAAAHARWANLPVLSTVSVWTFLIYICI